MDRVLISNVVPQEQVVRLKASQAANNFCFNLVKSGCFNEGLSIIPPSYSIEENNDNLFYYYANTGRGEFGKLYSHLINSIRLVYRARKYSNIWFYNVSSSSMPAYFLLRFIFRKKVYVILADHTPGKHFLSFQNLLERLIRKSLGIISLSSRTTIKTTKNKIVPGIILSSCVRSVNIKKIERPIKFLFSGTLSDVTGFDMALKVFSRVTNAELYISGNGEFPKEYEQYKNIHYAGFLEYKEYLKLYDKVDVCLNFRNPSLPENNNNFPSKILEYFSKNKIVFSTIDYPEIEGAKYIICEYDEEKLYQKVREILEYNDDFICKYANNAPFLLNNISEKSWKEAFEYIEDDGK